jgi:hypothetical protein
MPRLVTDYTDAEWAAMSDDERNVARGYMAPAGECSVCDNARRMGDRMMPSHTALVSCRSGRRNHCTCDSCY